MALTHWPFYYGRTSLFRQWYTCVYLSALILALQQKSPLCLSKVSSWICMWGSELKLGGSRGDQLLEAVKIQWAPWKRFSPRHPALIPVLCSAQVCEGNEWAQIPSKRKPHQGRLTRFCCSLTLAAKASFYTITEILLKDAYVYILTSRPRLL